MSIEKNIQELEEALSKLESDDIDLDKAVDEYHAALKLSKKTFKALEKIESKLTVFHPNEEPGTVTQESLPEID